MPVSYIQFCGLFNFPQATLNYTSNHTYIKLLNTTILLFNYPCVHLNIKEQATFMVPLPRKIVVDTQNTETKFCIFLYLEHSKNWDTDVKVAT